ncbi:MAG: LapA family protein [Acidimicrobiia bacterium]
MSEPNPKDTTTSAQPERTSRLGVGAVASLVGVALLLVFVLQNGQSVDVDFLAWTFSWPLWLLIVVAALLGALVWFSLGVVRRHRDRVRHREDQGRDLSTHG